MRRSLDITAQHRGDPEHMRAVPSLLILAFISSAVAQEPPPRDYLSSPACQGLDNTYRCAKAIELGQIGRSAGRARRSGTDLVLLLSSGGTIAVPGGITEPFSESAWYTYFGIAPRTPFYLLHAQFGEGNAFALVHTRTGRVWPLEGFPVPSPSGEWLLVGEDGYFNRIGVFLYQVAGDSVTLRWHLEPEDWVPGSITWTSDSSAIVERTEGSELATTSTALGRLMLSRSSHTWHGRVQ